MSMRSRSFVVVLAGLALVACGPQQTVVPAGDVTAPTIHSTSPLGGATEASLDVPLIIAFSEPMNGATVGVSLTPHVPLGVPIFDVDASNVTLVPLEPLAADTLYTVSIHGEDVAGNGLTGLTSFSFQTMKVDLVGPTLSATTPSNDARDVSLDGEVLLTFSERMSVGSVIVEVFPPVDLGVPTWTSSTTLRLLPGAGFAPLTRYVLMVRGTDLAGNDLPANTGFVFTTGAPPDVTPPTVSDTSPADGQVGVSNNTSITINFSEPMRTAETEAALVLRAGTMPIDHCAARWVWNDARTIVSCQPSSSLAFNTVYSVVVGVTARDDADNAVAAPWGFAFTTGAVPDVTPPTVVQLSPAASAMGIERTAYAELTFSESMDTASTQAAFSCSVDSATVGGSFSWHSRNRVLRFTPAVAYEAGKTVTCAVHGGPTGARDVAANRLVDDASWSFRVLRTGKLTAPPIARLDGWVSNAGSPFIEQTYAFVGDTSTNLSGRGFFTFNLAALPLEARRVTSAVLSLYFIGPLGAPESLGELTLEHLDYGPMLTGADFNVMPLASVVWNTPAMTGFHALSVVRLVEDDFANRVARGNRVQLRLRFSTDVAPDTSYDGVTIATSEWTTAGQRPVLTLEYEYP
jgi:methionine-rich copper-binding protein CopC